MSPPETRDELAGVISASCCCRYCQTLTTAAGIDNRGHGPGSVTCARMRRYIEDQERRVDVAPPAVPDSAQMGLF